MVEPEQKVPGITRVSRKQAWSDSFRCGGLRMGAWVMVICLHCRASQAHSEQTHTKTGMLYAFLLFIQKDANISTTTLEGET